MKKSVNGLGALGSLLAPTPPAPAHKAKPGPRLVRADPAALPAGPGGPGAIALARTIDMRCWRVIGQVARATKRDELLPVLLRAREVGTTDARDIAAHLLFDTGARLGVAQRLLQIAESFQLLAQSEQRYALTEAGHAALGSERIFVPEHGTWTIWASEDPLLASPILHVEAWTEPTAFDEVLGKVREAGVKRHFEHLPRWLKAAIGSPVEPIVGGQMLRIDQLEAKGEVVATAPSLRALWNVSARRLRIAGVVERHSVDATSPAPELESADVWRQLLAAEGLWQQWDREACALRVAFDDTDAGERQTFLRNLNIGKPVVEGYGAFDAATVERTAIRARTADEAQRWALWRLASRINAYATADRYRCWTEEALAPLAEFAPVAPSREALAVQSWRDRGERPADKTWHLVAADDWTL